MTQENTQRMDVFRNKCTRLEDAMRREPLYKFLVGATGILATMAAILSLVRGNIRITVEALTTAIGSQVIEQYIRKIRGEPLLRMLDECEELETGDGILEVRSILFEHPRMKVALENLELKEFRKKQAANFS